MSNSPNALAPLLAAALGGAWRTAPPPLDLSENDLRRVAPLLVGSGAAPLGWWKVRRTPLSESAPARELREVYRYHSLRSALVERDIERAFALLGGSGVEAVLVKGWAMARVYPEQGLRPFGDMDVCVRPEHFTRARRALDAAEGPRLWVDLHAGFDEADAQNFDELYARSESLTIGASRVRVLSAEDHLRLVCVHMLRHGAWRPLWLCDVAAAVENRPDVFDWSRVLGFDQRRARWVACAIGLARALLGARADDTPVAREASRLPRWLVPEVLKSWETPYSAMQAPMRHRAPMREYLRRPSGALSDLLNRWPNPIAATVHMNGAFNDMPRLPFQLGECAARTMRFVSRLPKNVRERQ